MLDHREGRLPGQVVVGIAVIGMGVLFLLDNLGLFDFGDALQFWPMLFILVGAVKIYDSRERGGMLVGVIFVGLGVMLTLQHMGLVYFSWRLVWPVVLILFGLSVVTKAMRGPRGVSADVPGMPSVQSDKVVNATAILGGFERRVSTPDFRGGEITAIMGGCALDLRESSITGEAVINVFAVMGGVTLRVPPDWTVIMRGTALLGGFDEKSAAPGNPAKRLVITGHAIMGGVEVRN